WLDGLIYLPLIIWGVHRLVDEGKMCPMIIPLSLMFIAHFYIGYMVGIFTFFYFVSYCLSKEGRVFAKNILMTILKFGIATVISLMCACIVLIPVYNSLKLGKLEFTEPDWSMATQFDFLTFITKLFPMSYDTVYPEGLPVIYCGSAALILVPLYFMNDRIGMKEKVSKGLLCALLFILMYIRPLDIMMHGFQVPNWLPFRYSFAFSLMFVWMSARAFENSDGFTSKQIGGVFASLLAFLFWCERENYEHFQIFDSVTDDAGEVHWRMQGIWFAIIALSVYFALIHLHRKYNRSKVLAVITVMLVATEMFCNASDTLTKIDKDVAYSTYPSYEPYMSDTRAAVQAIKSFDTTPYYRMEANFHRTVNDAIGTGYYSLSHSSSTMNAPALTLLKQLGYAYGGHYTKYDGSTMMTDSFFDIRYVMKKEGDNNRYVDTRIKVPEQYTLATSYKGEAAEYKFYENPYALGLGMVSSERITNALLSEVNPFENQNQIFNCIIGGNTY
ncbi:MAG: YfhO family protein, partial [Ruminococcus sp.]|nr:YfhO family protein [Ruminococcus sp.]